MSFQTVDYQIRKRFQFQFDVFDEKVHLAAVLVNQGDTCGVVQLKVSLENLSLHFGKFEVYETVESHWGILNLLELLKHYLTIFLHVLESEYNHENSNDKAYAAEHMWPDIDSLIVPHE